MRAFFLSLAAFSIAVAFDAPAVAGPADGVWSQIASSSSPPSGRAYCGVVYDPVRERMLAIGGLPDLSNGVWAFSLDPSPTWQHVSPEGTPPSPRFAHSLIYQPGRDRVILFGGFDGAFRNDVWALSLAGTPSWSLITPAGAPPVGRWAHVAIYDAARERMIVFGGYDGSDTRNDVWELSLGATPTWTQLNPGGRTPLARTNMDGVYDPLGNRLIVFGGFNTATQQFFDETWTLSLARNPVWTELHRSGSPSPRRDHSAVYDAARNRLVVFDGFDGAALDQTYALGLGPGQTWSAIDVAGTRPSARFAHRAIYDAARDRMVVFGGNDGSFLSDVWALPLAPGAEWSQIVVPAKPAARRHYAMVYAAGSAFLFGGEAAGLLGDAHLLSLGGTPQWQPLPATGAPSPRSGHRAIYDAQGQRVVVFGGSDGTFRSDVHAFSLIDGSWSALSPAGVPPSGRQYSAAVYDPVRERMLVVAGLPPMLSDVWALSLGASPEWQPVSPAGTPPSPRFAHMTIYQPGRDRVILFGGFDGAFRNDVWALSLAGTPSWSSIAPAGTPPAGRWSSAVIYDSARERMIVFGGYDGTATRNDVWALSLGATPTWTQLAPGGALPPARAYLDGVYDPVGNRMIVFGGFNTTTQQFFDDIWALTWGASEPQALPARAERQPARIALAGVRPNPAARELTIAFSLADASPATVEMMDVAGRRVLAREVGSFGAGDHELRIDETMRLPPGLYFVRLRQHGRALAARALIAH